MTKNSPSIVNKEQAIKILLHFPIGKRNFRLINIYKATRDGWDSKIFAQKVYNQGSTLILLKTTKDAICGGFTSLNWTDKNRSQKDSQAFVFNLDKKFSPINESFNAITTHPWSNNGFYFGGDVLSLAGG